MNPPRLLASLAFAAALGGCVDSYVVTEPQWPNGGSLGTTRPLTSGEKQSLEGIYVVTQGNSTFGDTLVLKWNGNYLGVYAGVHVAYMIMQAGATYDATAGDSTIYLQGNWRWQNGEKIGLSQASTLLHTPSGTSLVFNGAIGSGDAIPTSPVKFTFLRPITPALLTKRFYIMNHHGSGGTPTLMPASENSVQITKIIEQYGANSIEIDTRPTKDTIPVMYHDNTLNPRLVQKGPLEGPVENYTFAQLEQYVRLIHGEKIPTLAAMLDTIITATNLEFVYVDLKPTTISYLPVFVQVQQAAIAKAALLGRNVQIYLALTSDTLAQQFMTLPGYQSIPTICERDTTFLRELNSAVWSPVYTQGITNQTIDYLHGQGRQVITWTVDASNYLEQYITQTNIDGIDTDYTTLAAYYFWKQ